MGQGDRETERTGFEVVGRHGASVETSGTMVRSCNVGVVEDDGAAIGNGWRWRWRWR